MRPSFSYAASRGELLSRTDVTNVTELLAYCRQQLGTYIPVGPGPKKGLVKNIKSEMEYQGWTLDDLLDTVSYCQRNGYHVKDMWMLLKLVDSHLADTQTIDLQGKVAEALHQESDPVWQRRLSLAKGFALALVYQEWLKVRAT